jgi:cellulose synthase/poly-beta-1,6-N-acetylglucosamine synthase-like glycosyltransferase
MNALTQILSGFNSLTIGYFACLDAVYLVLAIIGWRAVSDYVARRPLRDYRRVAVSPLSPPITILVPAHNEEATIAYSLRALLANGYSQLAIIVVNDGSKDGTMDVLREEFNLVDVRRVPRSALTCKPIRAVLASADEPRLTVIDKQNGGKADSLNAGLRYARTPLFCCIDADTMLDPDALNRLVWEFESRPDTVAAGGIVRVVNGSRVLDGRVSDVRTPASLVANLQIMEYLRAFLSGRIAWSRLGMLMIISGAFGLFRRDAVVDAGGYDTSTVGEDAELILRLHRHQRDVGGPHRVVFFPDPICWTEVPTSMRILVRQRDRWQRGLLEMLWRHRGMVGRRRYGRIGLVAIPYFVVFEALGPAIELIGLAAFILSLALGIITLPIAAAYLSLAVGMGFIISYMTLLMEERAFQRYPGWSCLARLVSISFIENLGYRQLMALVRARGLWTVFRAGGWGEMTRAGFAPPPPAAPAPVAMSELSGVPAATRDAR